VVAVVDLEFLEPVAGNKLILRIQPYFPARPIMLVAVADNGFRSYAHFQTHVLLALLQLEYLQLSELDLSIAPPEKELPF